jgi:hypothetical protein
MYWRIGSGRALMFSGVGFQAGMSSTSKRYQIIAAITKNIGSAWIFRESGGSEYRLF